MSTPNRWLMLAVGMLAQASGTVAANAAVFLIPYLHRERGLSLVHAGGLASASLLGTTVSLVAWGILVGTALAIGAIPLLTGLIVVVPVLGHATWHLYRRAVK